MRKIHYNNKEILVFKDINKISDYAVKTWEKTAGKAINNKGSFSVALSGGKTPSTLYEKLSKMKDLPWDKTHIFMVDERFVPYNDENNNYRMINETFLRHVNIPAKNVHPILTTEITPGDSVLKYEEDLNTFFRSVPEFDLVLLGIGDDGHTASLFPGSPSLKETGNPVIAVQPAGKIRSDRITLTFPAINNSENIIFLASGAGKANTIKKVLESKKSRLPAAMVSPLKGSLIFLLDEDAASLLSKK
jgi:6-phosphogluconolactonase